MISGYITRSIESSLSKYKVEKIEKREATSNYRKAVNKISGWALKPNQNNHKNLLWCYFDANLSKLRGMMVIVENIEYIVIKIEIN